jgi:hypothetical protein
MIKSFFKINDFDEILNICLGTEKDSQSFLSFIKVIGNEVVMLLLTTQNDKDLIEVRRILRNIISQSKDNEQLKKFVQLAFSQVLVKDSVDNMADILKAGPKDVQSYFKSEQIAYKSLNPYIFVDLVEMILEDVPEVMFDAPKGEFK